MVGNVRVEVTGRAHVPLVALAIGISISGSSFGVYGTFDRRCAMQFRRARRLLSASTTYHGDSEVSVCTNISSLAREYSIHFVREYRSVAESFHRRIGSSMRFSKRRSCSSSLTENQYLMRMSPSSMRRRSKIGHWRRNRWYSCGVQKPRTRSTPARLYQLRSKRAISPAAGSSSMYRWKYHWVCCRSVGLGSATTRVVRGFMCSVIRLMTPPLPAASLPSNTTTMRAPVAPTHSSIFTSSSCNRSSSAS